MPSFHPDQPHYNSGSVQPIDLMESHFSPDEYRGFLKGNVIKYVCRYRLKEGVKDLGKAMTYLTWLKEFELKLEQDKYARDHATGPSYTK